MLHTVYLKQLNNSNNIKKQNVKIQNIYKCISVILKWASL